MNEQSPQSAPQQPASALSELPEDIRKQAEEAFLTGHYPYLLQALVVAQERCPVWRMVKSDDVFTIIELFNFAKDWDEQHPPKEGEFYLVSTEGAIGLCLWVEYSVQWLFTPLEPGPERDELVKDMLQRMEQMAAEEEGTQATTPVPPPVQAPPAAPVTAPPLASTPPPPPMASA